MAVVATVQEFLRRANVPYSVFPHIRAYTALQEAAVSHVPRRDWAKAVVCFVDREPIQAAIDILHRTHRAVDVRTARRGRLGLLRPVEFAQRAGYSRGAGVFGGVRRFDGFH